MIELLVFFLMLGVVGLLYIAIGLWLMPRRPRDGEHAPHVR